MTTNIFRFLYLFLIAGAVLTAVILYLPFNIAPSTDAYVGDPYSIADLVERDDITLRSRATELTKQCTDAESAAYTLFKHVVKEEEPDNMLVTLASYFENIDIPVQFIFTDERTYLLGCGLSKNRLYDVIMEDIKPVYTGSARVAGGQAWIKAPEIKNESNLIVSINASAPVDVYLLKSAREADFTNHLGMLCAQEEVNHTFPVEPGNAVAVVTSDTTKIDVTLTLADITKENMGVSYFRNKECLPFDPVAGKSWLTTGEMLAENKLHVALPK